MGDLDRQKSTATLNLNNTMNQFEKCSNEFEKNQKELTELLNSDFMFAIAHKKEIINNLNEIDNKFDQIKQHFANFLY